MSATGERPNAPKGAGFPKRWIVLGVAKLVVIVAVVLGVLYFNGLL